MTLGSLLYLAPQLQTAQITFVISSYGDRKKFLRCFSTSNPVFYCCLEEKKKLDKKFQKGADHGQEMSRGHKRGREVSNGE
jgi:hypothetical protein